MNINFATAYETLPARVRAVPQYWQSLSTRNRLIAGVVAAAIVALLLWWLLSGGSPKRVIPPPPVIVANAASRNVTVIEHTIGTVLANSTIQVTARVSGQMLSAGFKEGQIVHTGELLFHSIPSRSTPRWNRPAPNWPRTKPNSSAPTMTRNATRRCLQRVRRRPNCATKRWRQPGAW